MNEFKLPSAFEEIACFDYFNINPSIFFGKLKKSALESPVPATLV